MRYIQNIFIQYLLGTSLYNWFILLSENRFEVDLPYIPKAIAITIAAILLSPVALLEKLIFSRRVKEIKVKKDPVFIIGHWRSGTTFLVNLMSRDPDFAFFRLTDIYAPSVFLLLNPILRLLGKIMIPKKRPMDNIELNSDLPQEEEFAVANTSTLSMYHMTIFPRNSKKYLKYGLFENIPDVIVKRWENVYTFLLKKILYKNPDRRLLLKSPNNTCRIKALLELFPNAKFIHIYRNPYKVCASSLKMYRRIFSIYALQKLPGEEEAEDFQVELYGNFYRKYFKEKGLIPQGNLFEIKYEDFIKDPLSHAGSIYKKLGLEGFEEKETYFREYVESQKEYKTNKHIMKKSLIEKVKNQCQDIFAELDYEL